MTMLKQFFQSVIQRRLVLALAFAAPLAINAADTGKTFATPEAAVSALVAAASAEDTNALHDIFGPATADIANPDRVQAANELNAFTAALNQTNRLVRESDSKCVLEVGEDSWPFPVPIVKKDGRWFFDTAAGKDEFLNRRIGGNELATLQVCAPTSRPSANTPAATATADEVLKYAQKIISTPGAKDGFFWSPDFDGEISPLGPLAADAAAEGYGKRKEPRRRTAALPRLLVQDSHAPGQTRARRKI